MIANPAKPEAGEKEDRHSEYKKLMIKEVGGKLRASFLFVTQYRGLKVKELEELRRKLLPVSGRYLVARNSLSRIVLEETAFSGLATSISGQTGFVVGEKDALAISKLLVGYAKDHEALKICGGVVDGELLTSEKVKAFAMLPSREVLIGKAVFLIKSPLSNLSGVLSGTLRKLLYALQEISKTKNKEGG